MADPIERIQQAINSDKIVIFMKGNRSFPQCGFSAATVEVFEELGAPYSTVDVLADQEVRDAVKTYSNWPTIPQVFINGKFVGGCDIVRELHSERRTADPGEGGDGRKRAPVTNSIAACTSAVRHLTGSGQRRVALVSFSFFVFCHPPACHFAR